jgi:hypothetical protein
MHFNGFSFSFSFYFFGLAKFTNKKNAEKKVMEFLK